MLSSCVIESLMMMMMMIDDMKNDLFCCNSFYISQYESKISDQVTHQSVLSSIFPFGFS